MSTTKSVTGPSNDRLEPHTDSNGHGEIEPSPTFRVEEPKRRIGISIMIGVAALLVVMLAMYFRAAAHTNHVALAATAKPVSIERAKKGTFRPTRSYVGTLQPWALAKVGPQYISAYVGTVLVRPGAVVKRGEVLATLDCRNSSAASKEIAARAKALEERRNAVAHETDRMKQLIDGGFASENEVEQLSAKTSAQTAEVEGLKASLLSKSLEVDDCILRAPFSGEVADRLIDPGAYVRPGNPVVRLGRSPGAPAEPRHRVWVGSPTVVAGCPMLRTGTSASSFSGTSSMPRFSPDAEPPRLAKRSPAPSSMWHPCR